MMSDPLNDDTWDVSGTVEYVIERGYKRVTLQFPDELLASANHVYSVVRDALRARDLAIEVFLLADTTFNSLAVDEVAAEHIDADCVIHYGYASLSPVSSLPAYFVFPRAAVDRDALLTHVRAAAHGLRGAERCVLLLLDLAYMHERDWLVANTWDLPVVVADVPSRQLDPGANRSDRRALHTISQPPAHASGDARLPGSSTGDTRCAGSAKHGDSDAIHCCGTSEGESGGGGSADTGRCDGPDAAERSADAEADGSCADDRDCAQGGCQSACPRPRDAAGGGACCEAGAREGAALRFPVGALTWQLPEGYGDESACRMMWVGPSDGSAALTQLLMTYSAYTWTFYEPGSGAVREGLPAEVSRRLMRRYFLVEKTKNAAILGILVGTLGIAGYLDVIETLRRLAKRAGKKTYTMLMGKPSPTKLANFPEVEVWVQVADPQAMILDCKDYLAPIITPYEAKLALLEQDWDAAKYRMDYASVLDSAQSAAGRREPRFSLIDGSYHAGATQEEGADAEVAAGKELAVRADRALQLAATASDQLKGQIQPQTAAEYLLLKRSYQGAPSPLVGSEAKPVVPAVQGLSGRAAGYATEQCHTGSA